MIVSDGPGEMPVSLNEARRWMRMGADDEDAVVAQIVRAATNICEAFVGRALIVRPIEEVVALDGGAVRLAMRPVVAVDGVALLPPGGDAVALDPGGYGVAIGRDGAARVTVHERRDAARARIAYRAGMADSANGIPEAIRQGIIRMAQYLHLARDGDDAAPPAAVAALWQPWRRLTLGGGV
ncbi:MAG: hypothetical protein U0S50_00830 [Sphingopyxis sp.]|uniref:head-tail connector protein n=1 Tax=Sphingopyxis sp. TaxID=1908224 RepID=UPI002AB965AA|nr:hypothetical protein [Sphingopyxis sp.]MDZ3830343.1 hypothetical protein [Sphingopyxis sp.]